jgi:hypothetical protein
MWKVMKTLKNMEEVGFRLNLTHNIYIKCIFLT